MQQSIKLASVRFSYQKIYQNVSALQLNNKNVYVSKEISYNFSSLKYTRTIVIESLCSHNHQHKYMNSIII